MLYGREDEQAAVDGLLAAARDGRSGVLLLRGEPGIGKTALLDGAVARAGDGFRVIRAAGVEYEAELPFAGLSMLLAPGLDRLAALPGPQRRALERAFGLAEESSSPADRLLVGLATLGLLAELAADRPLLCVVDDLQWVDGASLDALLLAARRLQAEGVVLLLAARTTGGAADRPLGLPELHVAALSEADATRLLADRAGPELPAAARTGLLAQAAGNPLALTELPLTAEAFTAGPQPSGGVGALPLTSRLLIAFHGQVTGLPAATQTLLLVAAVEESGDLAVILPAAATLGVDAEHLAPAEEFGLVTVTPERRAAFRHPLLRAAVLQRAPHHQRLAAHRAVAGALPDGDRRTWHLALAATDPDPDLADALERAAVHAERRGGRGGAAAYERAARLTPDREGATRRLVLAAEAATEEGELARAEALADEAAARTDNAFAHALLDQVRATAHFWRGSYPTAHRLLLDAAAADIDPAHAARMLFQAFHTAWYAGEQPVAAVLDRLAALPLPEDDPLAPLARHLPAAVLPALGRPAGPLPAVRETAEAARRAGAESPVDLVQLCGATLVLGRDEETAELAAELVAEARAKGTVGVLPTLQFFLAEAELFHGRHQDAEVTATEALALARDTGQHQWVSQLTALLAYLAALDGRTEPSAASLAATALTTTGPQTAAPAAGHPWAHWALALHDLGQGRAGAAADRLHTLTTGPHRHHVSATRAVPDLVEAAVRLGTPERAAEPYERFARWTAAADRPWTAALRLRCQALLGPDELAEAAYRAALDLHATTNRPFEQARTALLYGEWLRRTRRRTDARPHLTAALETFDRLAAHPWSARARTELAATGTPTIAPTATSSLTPLTPQERQIARLAAQGLTNRDIAAQLYLSPRTVAHHLYKAYPKLGITSRTDLPATL
ncbi:ATP-binding protein [Streptomyces rubellomurinus]|uniref:Transcriptional regulator n=1 Tax=Streptomyces rubellomurinus (strain ATCC 31215) TaxID=359131 RepID=A0A0F2TER3_STRR3|nr:LuxR family transcriptional regulator [Streptomyces rubellomurinus]KJS60805.1 transcriptional regulator [Streptomyces rubellomurinus]